ncbi:hypothetical protein B0H14DRAFT_62843 [Mycena olivaceomarginata]|nr:hypothetical protein B0H14DRAFT_62843 [Mycena olivaceomarginata]
MCFYEVVADRYSACQHLEILYETGNTTDCGNERCKTSASHTHRAPNCGCAAVSRCYILSFKYLTIPVSHQQCPHTQYVPHALPHLYRKYAHTVSFTPLTRSDTFGPSNLTSNLVHICSCCDSMLSIRHI